MYKEGNMSNDEIWNGLSNVERRAVLDQLTRTKNIPSGVTWEQLDFGTKNAVVFIKTVPGMH